MSDFRKSGLHLWLVITLGLTLTCLAACVPTDAPEDMSAPTDPGPSSAILGTATAMANPIGPLPSRTPDGSEIAPETSSGPTPTLDGPPVPYDLTAEEIIAANAGESFYSGTFCVASPVGCACEIPELRRASFQFQEDRTLLYTFQIEEYTQEWVMMRIAPNQWEYVASIQDEATSELVGEGRALLSFTGEGYLFTQMIDFFETGIVICPDIEYYRLEPSTTLPPPTATP